MLYKRAYTGCRSFSKPSLLDSVHTFLNKASTATLGDIQATSSSPKTTKIRMKAVMVWLISVAAEPFMSNILSISTASFGPD